jgi:hypothetical protein
MEGYIDKLFKHIESWANMPLKRRYNVLLGTVIVVLGYVIINRQNALELERNEYKISIDRCNNRHDIISDIYDKKMEVYQNNFLEYIKEHEKDLRQFQIEFKKVENENIN